MASPTHASWHPSAETTARANLTSFMAEHGSANYAALHSWSVGHRGAFWRAVIDRLGIVLRRPPDSILDVDDGVENARWLTGAELNIAESCFQHPHDASAIVYRRDGALHDMSYGALRTAMMRFAAGLTAEGLGPGDRVAIAMAMNVEAVIAYLGIVWAGGIVVSIADSFAPDEIATRLRITDAKAVVTQDRIQRAGKHLPMYEKVQGAGADRSIVVTTQPDTELRPQDVSWDAFLAPPVDVEPHIAVSNAHTNILFSSGTTGDPKAIPWTQLTPIKAAMDGHFHHDIHPGDVVAWPTNLGWMMGPWLIYATLINGATMALHDDVPSERAFGEFVRDAGVTMLGVVPSLVAAWRRTSCMAGLDWSAVRVLSSTGEASNADDMSWLMTLAGGKPILEYCGGTEIGGGYLTGTVLQPAVPSTFTTPALGLDLRILDEKGSPAESGEVFIVPPSIGLSSELLNRDHHEAYFEETPGAEVALRRHGDHIEKLPGGRYRAQGRIDDTMNLGGIKVSSAEIERTVSAVDGLVESAAVAIPPPGGGPSRLVVFAVPEPDIKPERAKWQADMQQRIRDQLNPLFKIHDVLIVDALPRTASGKVMRRELRAQYAPADPS